MAGYDEDAAAMLQQTVADTIGPVAYMETQYSAEQIQKMIVDYAGRAAKRKAAKKPWQELASDFTYSFFESVWKVFGESQWVDQVDFTWIVAAAFKAYLATPDMAYVSEEEFDQVFVKETAKGLDCSRYYSWSAYVLKKVISGKAAQKKVRNAVDNCREELLKQDIDTAEEFATAWIEGSLEALGKEVASVLPQSAALHLFESYVQEGGGIPLWLMKAATDTVMVCVRTAISTIYSSIPEATDDCLDTGEYGSAAAGSQREAFGKANAAAQRGATAGGKGAGSPWGKAGAGAQWGVSSGGKGAGYSWANYGKAGARAQSGKPAGGKGKGFSPYY
eukprot:gnl/TRDRNA2_/TRDRNA2_80795_c0_seq1.p1 gnl/TRDRNA2_/TRDRNA2_80795_c0~~gnl/TRDRNA2_/TRDRNA2_80795_c0_seq1.p1  ORF type:complete len:334 (+),score=72.27 gnl/TRDRNA2_/TRDRNA2_80795_c0_seq1:56-1057(+)